MDVIIGHGTMGSPEINWFPWAKAEMEKRGHTVYVPRFPTPDGQTKENWYAALLDQTPIFGANTILIGHSISATFLLHHAESLSVQIDTPVTIIANGGHLNAESGYTAFPNLLAIT